MILVVVRALERVSDGGGEQQQLLESKNLVPAQLRCLGKREWGLHACAAALRLPEKVPVLLRKARLVARVVSSPVPVDRPSRAGGCRITVVFLRSGCEHDQAWSRQDINPPHKMHHRHNHHHHTLPLTPSLPPSTIDFDGSEKLFFRTCRLQFTHSP